jgi:hypothetical protein
MTTVTIITATTGTKYLKDNILSVETQVISSDVKIQHLVVVDGQHHLSKVKPLLSGKEDLMVLPYATGTEQYNGHRIYGGCTFFAKGEYIMYLDEDNWIDNNHVQSLVDISDTSSFSCSLRKITDMDGNYICNDDCESLGNWKSVLGDYFVDVNCFFLPKKIALQLAPLWYRRARHPEDQPEVDRILTSTLKDNKIRCNVSGLHTVNYRAGNRADSVQPTFFVEGNRLMKQHYGTLPWIKTQI